jgi:N-acyl amino acid synthase of PEP-CTERM/exosortase system
MKDDALEIFSSYFDIKIADTNNQDANKDAYRLRYQVFCEEFNFEDKANFPNRLEHDLLDINANHAIITHKNSNVTAGCVRLLLPKDTPLPFEQFLNKDFVVPKSQEFHYGELSRLAVNKIFRRREIDGTNPTGINADYLIQFKDEKDKMRSFPLVAVALMLAGVVSAYLSELDVAYAMMEPKLVYVMHQYGIYFQQVGEVSNYHGSRAPFCMDPSKTLKTIHPELIPLLNYIYDKLKPSYKYNNYECA